jgi:enoyl-CoA hydratase/carnithine racemase
VVTQDQLRDTALAMAEEIASGPTQSIHYTKSLLYANMVRNEPIGVMLAEDAILNELTGSPPAREAATAFREKRDPDFRQFD